MVLHHIRPRLLRILARDRMFQSQEITQDIREQGILEQDRMFHNLPPLICRNLRTILHNHSHRMEASAAIPMLGLLRMVGRLLRLFHRINPTPPEGRSVEACHPLEVLWRRHMIQVIRNSQVRFQALETWVHSPRSWDLQLEAIRCLKDFLVLALWTIWALWT